MIFGVQLGTMRRKGSFLCNVYGSDKWGSLKESPILYNHRFHVEMLLKVDSPPGNYSRPDFINLPWVVVRSCLRCQS